MIRAPNSFIELHFESFEGSKATENVARPGLTWFDLVSWWIHVNVSPLAVYACMYLYETISWFILRLPSLDSLPYGRLSLFTDSSLSYDLAPVFFHSFILSHYPGTISSHSINYHENNSVRRTQATVRPKAAQEKRRTRTDYEAWKNKSGNLGAIMQRTSATVANKV